MSIRVKCDACDGTFAVPDKFAGKKGKCPKCGAILMVPDASDSSVTGGPVISTSSGSHSGSALRSVAASRRRGPVSADSSSDRLSAYRAKHRGGPKVPVWAWFVVAGLVLVGIVGAAAVNRFSDNKPVAKVTKKKTKASSRPTRTVSKTSTSKTSTGQKKSDAPPKFDFSNAFDRKPPKKPSEDATLQDVYDYVEHGVVLIRTADKDGRPTGLGSGFIIGPSGLIATNYHVVKSAASAKAVFHDESSWNVLGYMAISQEEDIAILKVEGMPGDAVVLDIGYQDKPRKLDEVVAIGHPHNHQFAPFDGRVSRVVHTSELPSDSQAFLSKLGGKVDHLWIEHKTGIAPGNSGGPLIDYKGHVLGINTWVNGELETGYALHVRHIKQLRYSRMLAEMAPLTKYQQADATTHTIDRGPQLSADQLRELYNQCDKQKWEAASNEDYRRLQKLAHAITFIKFADEHADPGDPQSDKYEALAPVADELIGKLKSVDWHGFEHVDKVNDLARRAVGSPMSGIFLFGTVERSVSEGEKSGAFVALDGTDLKLFVTTDEKGDSLPPGAKCMVMGMCWSTVAYGDNPLKNERARVILSKTVIQINGTPAAGKPKEGKPKETEEKNPFEKPEATEEENPFAAPEDGAPKPKPVEAAGGESLLDTAK